MEKPSSFQIDLAPPCPGSSEVNYNCFRMLQVDVKNHAVMRLKLISESEVGTMDSFTAFLWFLAAISSIRCQNAPTETTAAHFLHLVAASTDGNAAEPETVLAAGEAISSLGNLSVLDGYVLQNRTVFISGVSY